MELTVRSIPNNGPYTDSAAHILLVAEDGFSMLDIYANGQRGIAKNVIKQFADMVNTRNEAGSLHPQAPISAIPRKFLRELSENITPAVIDEIKDHLADFLRANMQHIRATKIVVDLRVSPAPVPKQYLDAVRELLAEPAASQGLEEVILIEG